MKTIDPITYSRREFGKLALASVPLSLALARADSKVHGVRIGTQSYSFRTLSLDDAIKAMQDIGIGECELWQGHVEPRAAPRAGGPRPQTGAQGGPGGPGRSGGPGGSGGPGRSGGSGAPGASAAAASSPQGPPPPAGAPPVEAAPAGAAPAAGGPPQGGPRGNPAAREELRKWRLSTPLDHFTAVKKKFDAAGVTLQAYNLSFNDSFTDEEIDRGFEMAKALGVPLITASATVSTAKRVAPFADKHRLTVAMHNHSAVKDPNQFATPESFATALGYSKHFAINLDIGHFVAGGNDPIAYLEQHHAKITNLHIKDRKKDQGPNTVWGEGDTPIKAVLQLLKAKKWDIPANIEYEYKGEDAIAEVRKCFQFCKDALA